MRSKLGVLFLLVCCLGVGTVAFIQPVHATTFFSDDFETGNLSSWTTTVGSPHVISNGPFSFNGTYCMNITSTSSSYVQETLADNYSLVYTRFYFKVPTLPSNNNTILTFYDRALAAYETNLTLLTNGKLQISDVTGLENGTHVLSTNIWQCVELSRYFHLGGPQGWETVWVNGTVEINATETSYSTNLIGQIQLGKIDSGSAFTEYFDSVVIADNYIGPFIPPVFLTIISPTNSTYTGDVNATLLAYGGTGIILQWNVQYPNGTFLFVTNHLYGNSINITNLTYGSYTFGAYAYNTQGGLSPTLLVDFTRSPAPPVHPHFIWWPPPSILRPVPPPSPIPQVTIQPPWWDNGLLWLILLIVTLILIILYVKRRKH